MEQLFHLTTTLVFYRQMFVWICVTVVLAKAEWNVFNIAELCTNNFV